MVNIGDIIIIKDTRPCAIQGSYILTDNEADIYKICETAQPVDTILAKLHEKYPEIAKDDLKIILTNLCNRHLMIRDNERYLSLAVNINQS
jgi:hypothetical protein